MLEISLTKATVAHLASFKQLWLGYSGGLDSTVLLHLLASQPELITKLNAIHVNHQLNSCAHQWVLHCQAVCQQYQVAIVIDTVTLNAESNLEAAARKARFQVFARRLKSHDCLLLAHHQDDQAETLLLQLCRGAGINGLAAMHHQRLFALGTLIRPLLGYSKAALTAYAKKHQLSWVEDDSNQNSYFNRNFLRNNLLPTLKSRWPGVTANLARTASHCEQAQELLNDLADIDYPGLSRHQHHLDIKVLARLKPERRANVLRVWFKKNSLSLPDSSTLKRIETEVIFAGINAHPCVTWQDNGVRRFQQKLYRFKKSTLQSQGLPKLAWNQFPAPLVIDSYAGQLYAKTAVSGLSVPPTSTIYVRSREPGDTFLWHGQTKLLKKLLPVWQVPPWQRDTVLLVFINDSLAAVVGFAIADNFYQHQTQTQVSACYHLTFRQSNIDG